MTQHPPHPHCDHECVCRCYPTYLEMNGIPCCHGVNCQYDTRKTPASHQRIEQIERMRERAEYKKYHPKTTENMKTYWDGYETALRNAIALLCKGDNK